MAPDEDSVVIALQDPRVYLTGEQVQDVDDQNQGKFPAGEFAFPFIFTVPDGVSSSDKMGPPLPPYGYTLYALKATVERSGKSNLKATKDVTIFEKVDVSQPEFQVPKIEQKDDQVCCCCCQGGIIRMNAKLNKWGYYPGDTIQAKLYVENMSDRDITYVEIVLGKRTLYQYRKKKDKVEPSTARIVSEKTSTGVGIGQYGDFDCLTLVIPNDLPPSTGLETESIIRRSYEVWFVAHVQGSCIPSALMEIPIKIGSYIHVD